MAKEFKYNLDYTPLNAYEKYLHRFFYVHMNTWPKTRTSFNSIFNELDSIQDFWQEYIWFEKDRLGHSKLLEEHPECHCPEYASNYIYDMEWAIRAIRRQLKQEIFCCSFMTAETKELSDKRDCCAFQKKQDEFGMKLLNIPTPTFLTKICNNHQKNLGTTMKFSKNPVEMK